MRAMAQSLEERLPGQLSFTSPQGGMFIWANCAAAVNPQRLFQAAVDAGVLYVPGAAFYPADPNPHTMRLSYAAPSVDDILEGVARLAKAVHQAQR